MRLPKAVFITFLAAMILASPTAMAGSTHYTATGDQLRALFIQRLVKYVVWPDGDGPAPGGPVIVAATDPARLRPYFNDNGPGPRCELVQWPTDKYHVLVVTGTPSREIAAILQRVADRPILTIGQNPENLRLGIIVNFHMVQGRIRLQINADAAQRAGLLISSRLMKIAQVYREHDDD